MRGVTYEMIQITPAVAEQMLSKNQHNRSIRPRHLDSLVEDMRAGEWRENGETIKIARDGTIIDGQHRLEAVLRSQASQRFLVVRGLPMAAQETVDTGARRSFVDALKLRGEANNSTLAALVRRVWFWERGMRASASGRIAPTMSQLVRTLEAHPELRESARFVDGFRKGTGIHGSVLSLTHWLFTQIDENDAKDFFEKLINGDGLPLHHPVLTLRRTVADLRRSRRGLPPEELMLAYMIKAWNAYREGHEVKFLRFRPGGAHPEAFPTPV